MTDEDISKPLGEAKWRELAEGTGASELQLRQRGQVWRRVGNQSGHAGRIQWDRRCSAKSRLQRR
jgi:hypothetical protein